MPTFSDETPRIEREFYGQKIAVPAVFTKGYKLTDREADWANGQLATVIGNRFGASIRAEHGKDVKATNESVAALGWNFQEVFDEAFASYVLGESNRKAGTGAGGKAADPVGSLVAFLAKQAISAKIRAKGLKVKDFMDAKVQTEDGEVSKFVALVRQYADQNAESLRAQAEAQLAQTTATASDDSDLELTPSPVSEAA